MTRRDYSLLGEDGRRAVETGLAAAEWYHTEVPRAEMKELMRRSDMPAVRDTALWLGSMAAFAGLGVALWPGWLSLPFWLAYGVLYGSASDSRWHEAGHGTAFKTRWMNDAVYQIACFMIMRNPVEWRWSHARHHTDTLIVGRDPEIAIMRPVRVARALLQFVGIPDCIVAFRRMLLYARGKIDPETASFVPERERPKAFAVARVWLLVYASAGALAVGYGSILPLMIVGLPRLYGAWHFVMTGYLQHGGLDENVLDHRLNSRTVHMNPISRFIYWNMNYHVEHHMFPMVPYHRLPDLHERIGHDLPAPCPSIWAAYREALPAMARQLHDPDWRLVRALPPTARPYREDLHAGALGGAPAE